KMGGSAGQTPILRSQSMSYATGCHTVFHHRYHIVWVTKYRYKVLEGTLRERIRTIIRQVCKELGVQIVSGVLSKEQLPCRSAPERATRQTSSPKQTRPRHWLCALFI